MIEELLNQGGKGKDYICTYAQDFLKEEKPINFDTKFEKLMNIQNITYL